jgi:hypothetical protein
MKSAIFTLLAVLGFVSGLIHQASAQANKTTEELIAIDILLEPNQAMIDKASTVNARLRGNYPAGIRWTPHTRHTSRCCNASFE